MSHSATQSDLLPDTEPFHGAAVNDDDEEYEVDSESEDWEYDQEAWDSDGEPLIDPQNPAEPLYNFDPDATEIEEDDAVALLAFGSMYRDSRKAPSGDADRPRPKDRCQVQKVQDEEARFDR